MGGYALGDSPTSAHTTWDGTESQGHTSGMGAGSPVFTLGGT